MSTTDWRSVQKGDSSPQISLAMCSAPKIPVIVPELPCAMLIQIFGEILPMMGKRSEDTVRVDLKRECQR